MKDTKLTTCGCCEVSAAPTPKKIDNRPGLSAIQYRVGTFASFRQAMIETIACEPKLEDWTARTSDDYGIALLEMWAYLADILTFYQERIANEAFLRTAALRESVMRLARLLDYEPAPGVAATIDLAFTLEKDKQVTIPIGLRVQSVPGQGEKPQKFETVATVDADASLNQVQVFPQPQNVNALEQNSPGGITSSEIDHLSPGDKLVVFDSTWSETKEVAKVTKKFDRNALTWKPTIQYNGYTLSTSRMFKYTRQFRLFGHDAPSTYLTSSVDSRGILRWSEIEEGDSGYSFSLSSQATADLDGRYDDLKPGIQLLVTHRGTSNFAQLVTIADVTQCNVTFGPLEDAVTRVTLSSALPDIPNRRGVTIYEVVAPEIIFWDHYYPATISGSAIYVPLSKLKSLAVKHALTLDDKTAKPQTVTVTKAEAVDTDSDGTQDHLEISFSPALTRELDTETAVLYGNVAKATHGETVSNEVLGSGDASTEFQSFTLKKPSVTFVPKAGAPNGAANTLGVRVDGILWKEVTNLYGHKESERVYTTSVNDEEEMTVWFGDGVTGARLPSGRNNVTASYREGLGASGNVKAGMLKTLLDRPVGLKGVINLAAAQGGADPETLKKARTNAPNTVRTFGRIVSLRDFEDAAREYAGVAKARAACVWEGEERAVHLVVAGDNGVQIQSTTLENLSDDLDSRRDPNRKLSIAPHQQVRVSVEAAVQAHADYVDTDVQTAAEKALQDYFAFDNLELGQPIHLSDVYRVLQDVEGVVSVDVDHLNFVQQQSRTQHGASEDPVQRHLRIFHNELAVVDPATDAIVKIKTEKNK